MLFLDVLVATLLYELVCPSLSHGLSFYAAICPFFPMFSSLSDFDNYCLSSICLSVHLFYSAPISQELPLLLTVYACSRRNANVNRKWLDRNLLLIEIGNSALSLSLSFCPFQLIFHSPSLSLSFSLELCLNLANWNKKQCGISFSCSLLQFLFHSLSAFHSLSPFLSLSLSPFIFHTFISLSFFQFIFH